ncbi:hypothetical protein AB4Z50_13535 [Paenibacillus sp. 2TAB26]|uniref:hypothetical protein n=1 Tax=Paenibacillus sp. 2TAB26 TaxID=3233005 RepID=UPI003F96B0BD
MDGNYLPYHYKGSFLFLYRLIPENIENSVNIYATLVMQSIKMPVKLDEKYSSLFVFNIHYDISNDTRLDFFYSDDIFHSQIAVQTGDIGIICCIGDNKAVEHRLNKYFEPYYGIKLHPVQFRLSIAEIFYLRTLLKNRTSSIYTDDEIILLPPFFDSIDEYNYKTYAMVLFYFLRSFDFKFEDIYDSESDATLNLLINKDKRLIIYGEDNNIKLGEIHNGFSGDLLKEMNVQSSAFPIKKQHLC